MVCVLPGPGWAHFYFQVDDMPPRATPGPQAPATHHCSQGSSRPTLTSPEVETVRAPRPLLAHFSNWPSDIILSQVASVRT